MSAESRAVSTDSESEIGRPTAEFNQLSLNDTLNFKRQSYILELLMTTPSGFYSASLIRMIIEATTKIVLDMSLDHLYRLLVHYIRHI